MLKTKSSFQCASCQHQNPKWLGQCPQCKAWNTLEEITTVKSSKSNESLGFVSLSEGMPPVLIEQISGDNFERMHLQDPELERVLGGGLVPGALILFGGEPGIGKSTLLLQLALQEKERKILYVSGEESMQQIRLRAERLGISQGHCFVVAESNLSIILNHSTQIQPDVLIIDSIQTLYSPLIEANVGSLQQIRQCASELMKLAKEKHIPVFLIGHITKEGNLAGPKVLEHLVDVVLQFEGDPNFVFRMIRSHKNRFGATHELGIYEMTSKGLFPANPSQLLISSQDHQLSGVAIASLLEGIRPLHLEIQALATPAAYGTPQRVSNGFDAKRLQMLLAILEKRCNFKLYQRDIFINLTGGLSPQDPAMDLAVLAALVSSVLDKPISRKTCFAAEVGLTGEIRPVARLEQRILEAERLGYQEIIISAYQEIEGKFKNILVHPIHRVPELFAFVR